MNYNTNQVIQRPAQHAIYACVLSYLAEFHVRIIP